MAKKENDLYIGVNSDLSPFSVDLNALTRGLVVVGQSGCGKSFLLGRLVEEIVRQSTDKTRVLVVDSNSDFCHGTVFKSKGEFSRTLGKYQTGLLDLEYRDFRSLEMEYLRILKSTKSVKSFQVFGGSEPFNLSWKLLVNRFPGLLKYLKAGSHSSGYYFAALNANAYMRGEYKGDPEHWTYAVIEILNLIRDPKHELKYIVEDVPRANLNMCTRTDYLEFLADLYREIAAGYWQGTENPVGLPQRLFSEGRVNYVEIEKIKDMHDQVRFLIYLLHMLVNRGRMAIEKCREVEPRRNHEDKYDQALKGLKHTFIIIDEVHKFAPDHADNSHERLLGDLIHLVASEGRKYGLHLILASQRPNKVKRGLLGECDNAIIMKMNSRSDLEHLAQEMRILDVTLLEPCLHFQGQGNAIAVGEMTRMAPYVQLFKSAPRRTVEGGVDIEGF